MNVISVNLFGETVYDPSLGGCYTMNVCTANLYVMVFVGRAFGMWTGHKMVSSGMGLMLLKKRLMEIPCCFPHMRTQEKGDYLRTGMWVLTRDWSCQLPSFQNSEKYMCVAYKLSRLWDCIIVTQVKTVLYENWIVKSNKTMKNGLVPSELRCVNKVSVSDCFIT